MLIYATGGTLNIILGHPGADVHPNQTKTLNFYGSYKIEELKIYLCNIETPLKDDIVEEIHSIFKGKRIYATGHILVSIIKQFMCSGKKFNIDLFFEKLLEVKYESLEFKRGLVYTK